MIFDKSFGLDREEVFLDYLRLESYYDVANLYTDGRFKPTHQTIKNNVWKWACRNTEKSFQLVREFMKQAGNDITEEEWERELVWNSRYGLGTKEREDFLNKGNRREILIKMSNNEEKRFGYGLHSTRPYHINPK